jgi:ferric-dicitrate binding protein FerR (iron transport regulator)
MNREIEGLLARHLAGETLSTAELDALARLMAAPEGEAVVDQVLLDRILRHHYTNASRAEFTAEVLGRLESQGRKASPIRRRVMRHLSWRRWGVRRVVIAACLAVGGVVGLVWWMRPPEARIVATTAAKWAQGANLEVGAKLRPGSALKLEQGFVAVQFSSGATLLLEGAAELEINTGNSATLHRGSAVAEVPESAHGFTVSSPQGKVVDLGTNFAVRTSTGGMEVHVLQGEVEAHPSGKPMVKLKKDAAVRIDGSGVAHIPVEAHNFLTSLPPERPAAPPWLHWSFDEGAGLSVAATGVGLPLGAAQGRLTSLPGSKNLPAWEQGICGSGLKLHGKDDYVQTNYAGISGAGPRTVACWVRVPQDLVSEGFALVGWGAHQEFGDTWQMSINTIAHEGPVGRLRIGTHMGHAIGQRDLRDGQWHHVAAVLYPGPEPDVSTHVLLYVDGSLEPAACKTVRRVNTTTTGAFAQSVAFGKNTGVRSADRTYTTAHTFRGSLDEITLCAAALSESDIHHLMHHGTAFLQK